MKQIALALIVGALALSACQSTQAPTAGAYPAPPEHYTCLDSTQLVVRLLGQEASVAVNGATPVSLPAMGSGGTTYSNGRQTLTIVQGQVSWALGRAMPVECNVSGS